MTVYIGLPATEPLYSLAEGILWDDRASRVRWVDIQHGQVLSAGLVDDRLVNTRVIEVGQSTGAVALAEDGGLLIAAARGLGTVSPSGQLSLGPDLLGARENVRFNDGSVDPHGRFVVGTLSLVGAPGTEVLLRVSQDGSVQTLRTHVQLSNGIAFSPDGEIIYHVDTLAGTVSGHSYGAGPFNHEEPWVTILDDLPAPPDGLTVDSTGALWIALWGNSSVNRYSPTGELLDSVTVDAAQASCPAFVGPELDRLGITTAQVGLENLTDLAGALFLAEVDATGSPANRWAGSTTTPYWHELEGESDA